MALTQNELQAIRDSFGQVRQDMGAQSVFFYEALFRRAPEFRKLFREDIEGQGMKFMTTLEAIIEKLDQEMAVDEEYTNLGRKHAGLGIKASQFEVMGEALIDTLRNVLGDDLTLELEASWRKAYALVSANMIRRGEMAG